MARTDTDDSSGDTANGARERGGSRLSAVLGALNRNAERYLIYMLYTYLTFIIIAEVLRRFVLDFSSLWGSRTAIFMYIYITYLGMSWAVYKRAHIRLDAVFDVVSERTEGYLYLFSDAMMFLFAVLTLRYSIPLLQTSLEFGAATQALRVNRAFFQAAIPIGFGLFAVRVLQRTYYDWRAVRRGEPVYEGEPLFDEEEEGTMNQPAEQSSGSTPTGGER